MYKVAKLSHEERKQLFQTVAIEMGIKPDMIEKDFWVCFMLYILFSKCKYKNLFVFKGGTSLSKSYHVIKRFSEDIDLVLDWRKLIDDEKEPYLDRSRTKQDEYNKMLNNKAKDFYIKELIPNLNNEVSKILDNNEWVRIDDVDDMVIDFLYPKVFDIDYITPSVKLEIGPIAEWLPSHTTTITPFVAEKYQNLFTCKNVDVLTIDAARTFWEKITILHKLAYFPIDKSLPIRYARHLYDIYCMGNSDIKKEAFLKKELFEKDVAFKDKFYYSKGSHYESATLRKVMLIPAKHIIKEIEKDYKAMVNMIYGEIPKFGDIIQYLMILQEEIHNL